VTWVLLERGIKDADKSLGFWFHYTWGIISIVDFVWLSDH
jgi:hypothetical protein